MTPRKRAQQSLDNPAEYERERRTFGGLPDIISKPITNEYRQGWERIWGGKRKEAE